MTTIWGGQCLISRLAPVLHSSKQVVIILCVVVSADKIVSRGAQTVGTGSRRCLSYSQRVAKALEKVGSYRRGSCEGQQGSSCGLPPSPSLRVSCELDKCHPEEQLIY